jgi:hypothetical protein
MRRFGRSEGRDGRICGKAKAELALGHHFKTSFNFEKYLFSKNEASGFIHKNR